MECDQTLFYLKSNVNRKGRKEFYKVERILCRSLSRKTTCVKATVQQNKSNKVDLSKPLIFDSVNEYR
jgi:hypothetical protein